MIFWTGAGLLLFAVLLRLLWASFRGQPSSTRAGVARYQSQTYALSQAATNGEIADIHLAGLKTELARAILEDAAREPPAPAPASRLERYVLGLLVLIILPATAIPLYLHFGTPNLPNASTAAAHLTPEDMIALLQTKIERAPQDPEPRMWLARVYMANSRYAEAVKVFDTLNTLAPKQPAILLQFADALAMAQGGSLSGRATTLIQQALALEPTNMTGLWLAGVAADQSGKPREALDYLSKAKAAAVGTEAPTAELDALIAEVEARSGLKAPTPVAVAVAVASTTPQVEISVSADPSLTAALPADTAVFVLAKAVDGPPMPLAVKRLALRELPKRITLDDSLAMSPQHTLSSAKNIILIARISLSGQPLARPGDIEGRAGPLKLEDAHIVKIRLDTVLQ